MEQLLQLFILIPFLGFVLSTFFSNHQERYIAFVTNSIIGIQLFALILFTSFWMMHDSPILNLKHFVFYKEDNIEIFFDFYFDKITAVFAILGATITFLVTIFSKYYLHRDSGYKRFFTTISLFYFGYNITIFSGNFETLFVGWEFIGITSFLLIAFFRDRYLPVKNALKTISLYRLGDICLILALWTSHHIWHENITFFQLNNQAIVNEHIANNYPSVVFLICMIVISASIKSAQFPFSSWLSRSMEGPTPSSAVFYGSLSVHLGVFLLLRTYQYWSSILIIKGIIISIGVLTAIVATLIASVQSTVKTQIAYSSIAQIGLMLIEVALGWHYLALIHIAGNALLRSYQLLISPSILGYMIHNQFYNFKVKTYNTDENLINKIRNSIYVFCIQEWNLDNFLKNIIWNPLKAIGKLFQFISNRSGMISLSIFYILGLIFLLYDDHIPPRLDENIHLLFAFIGMILILLAFVEKRDALKAWLLIIISQFYIVLSIALINDEYEYSEILLYVCGLFVAACIGVVILVKLKNTEKEIALNDFYGHVYQHPIWAFWFLIACLAFVCLPFTPSFIGIDLMFSHIDHDEYALIVLTSISFLVLELSALRIYARLFLGPHKKQTHPIAYRSS